MAKNINLFISSLTSGFIKINNSEALSTENTIFMEIELSPYVLVEFYPISSLRSDIKPLPTFITLFFTNELKFTGNNAHLIKYTQDTYELIFEENLLDFTAPKLLIEKNISFNAQNILINVFTLKENNIIIKDNQYILIHSSHIELVDPKIHTLTVDNYFLIVIEDKKTGYLLIVNKTLDLDIAYEDISSYFNEDKIIKENIFKDSKKRKSTLTFSFNNGYYDLKNITNKGDIINTNIPKDNRLLAFLFIESYLANFENECLGYLTPSLKEKIDFDSLKTFFKDFVDIKENIYTNEDKYPILLIYKKEEGYYFASFLNISIKNNLIDNIIIT